jgi:hypothetical protein
LPYGGSFSANLILSSPFPFIYDHGIDVNSILRDDKLVGSKYAINF